MTNLTWTTEKRKVKDLIPYDRNPRSLSDEKASKLKQKQQVTKYQKLGRGT